MVTVAQGGCVVAVSTEVNARSHREGNQEDDEVQDEQHKPPVKSVVNKVITRDGENYKKRKNKI